MIKASCHDESVVLINTWFHISRLVAFMFNLTVVSGNPSSRAHDTYFTSLKMAVVIDGAYRLVVL